MNIRVSFSILFAVTVVVAAPCLHAVTTAGPRERMEDAVALRRAIATAVASGEIEPSEGLRRLAASRASSGLEIEPAADLALAAIDIGRRLVARQLPDRAEPFFIHAEEVLSGLADRTSPTAAVEKAQYLRYLAFVRRDYLNKAGEAYMALSQARVLQPDDPYLKAALTRFAVPDVKQRGRNAEVKGGAK